MPRTPYLRQRSRWQLPATATTSTTTSATATATALVPIFPYLSHLYEQNGKTPQLKVPIILYLRQRSRWQLPATTSTTTSATATARSPSHLLGAAAAPACLLYTSRSECICSIACTQQSDFPIQLSQYDTDSQCCGYEMHCRTSAN